MYTHKCIWYRYLSYLYIYIYIYTHTHTRKCIWCTYLSYVSGSLPRARGSHPQCKQQFQAPLLRTLSPHHQSVCVSVWVSAFVWDSVLSVCVRERVSGATTLRIFSSLSTCREWVEKRAGAGGENGCKGEGEEELELELIIVYWHALKCAHAHANAHAHAQPRTRARACTRTRTNTSRQTCMILNIIVISSSSL